MGKHTIRTDDRTLYFRRGHRIGSATSPVYTSELAAEHQRGWLVNLFVVFIQLGIFISFIVSYGLSTTGNWRLMIGLGIVPALLLMIAIYFLPESPRWLILKNQSEKARTILSRLYEKMKQKKNLVKFKHWPQSHLLASKFS